jgi:hypothetical protein
VIVHHEEAPSTGDQSGNDDALGHSHSGTAGTDLVLRTSAAELTLQAHDTVTQATRGVRGLSTLAWSPHRRPPRTRHI